MSLDARVYHKIVCAKLFMDENFGEPLSLEQVSKRACLSRFHFHRLFTSVYGKTPHRYITEKRLIHARDLLSGENMSISQVCSAVGFESIGSFCSLFKKIHGYTPGHYRKLKAERKALEKEQPRRFIPACFLGTASQPNK
jgi:transcriptional regulator GlxA family with amidase domain